MTRNFYTLDGIPLHDPQGRWTLGDGAEIRSVPARRKSSYVIPGQDGEVANVSPSFDPGKLSFNIHILTNNNHDDAMKTLEFWNGVLGQRHRLLPLDHTYNGQTRRAMVQITASSETSHFAMKMITISVICDIPGSFWRDIDYKISETSLTSGTYTLSSHSGGTGPINDAIIKLIGPYTKVTVESIVGTTPISYFSTDMALSADSHVVIDTGNWLAVSRRTDTSWGMTGIDMMNSIAFSSGMGSMFLFDPSMNPATLGSDYKIRVTSTGATTASKIQVRARRSFL